MKKTKKKVVKIKVVAKSKKVVTKKKKLPRYRSAENGKYVTKTTSLVNPKTTVKETK